MEAGKTIALTAVSLFLFLGAFAMAGARENNPGAACVAIDGASLNVRFEGEVENRSPDTITAICPSDRRADERGVEAEVLALDRHPTRNICCRAINEGPLVCTEGATPEPQTLRVTRSANTDRRLALSCTLPPMAPAGPSAIQEYRTRIVSR